MNDWPELRDLPGAESVRWVLEHSRPGAPRACAEDLIRHVVVDPAIAETMAEHMWLTRQIAEVTGWRQTADGRVVVNWVSVEGRAHLLSWRVAADGRLEDQVSQRAETDGDEIVGMRTAELTDDQRTQLHAVFAATYTDPDPDYLDGQLATMQAVGMATESGEVIAFTLYGWAEIDLPVIGTRGVGFPGLACVRPTTRRQGLAGSCAGAAGPIALAGPMDLTVTKLATPASLRLAVRAIASVRWPTADAPFALQLQPTPTQVLVTAALAQAVGCHSAKGAVCVGHGRPIGYPNVEPEVTPEMAALFEPVDRSRGDSLLWIAWVAPPPPEWFS